MGHWHLWAVDGSLTVTLHLAPSSALPCISERLSRSCGHSDSPVLGSRVASQRTRGLHGQWEQERKSHQRPAQPSPFISLAGPQCLVCDTSLSSLTACPWLSLDVLGDHSVVSVQFTGLSPTSPEDGILRVQTVLGESLVQSPRAKWLPRALVMNLDILPGKPCLPTTLSSSSFPSLQPHWPLPLLHLGHSFGPQGLCICCPLCLEHPAPGLLIACSFLIFRCQL